MSRRRRAALGAVVLVIAIGGALLLALGPDGAEPAPPASRADAVPYDGRSPRQPGGAELRVLLELQRPALGRLAGISSMDGAAQRAYVVSLRKEAAALRGALRARGVRLSDVVGFESVWNGFAATVRTRDLAAISSLGVRAQPVRRFYPAVSEPAGAGTAPPPPRAGREPPAEQEPIALLASGVRTAAGVEAGADVVESDGDAAPGADPRDARRVESGGTALAGVLLQGGERVRPIRVAAMQATPQTAAAAEEYGTSDTLLTGLERAVDPDGDGDSADRVAVALAAVSAPYAGFAGAPESEAVRGAARLGTLVIAPAGNEGPARPPGGTIASPGGAAAALTVGALSGGDALPSVELRAGDQVLGRAAVLAGRPGEGILERSRTIAAGTRAADIVQTIGSALEGALAVVEAQDAPGVQAVAAATAGARAVLIAEPRRGRPLAAIPAGAAGVPVLGVTGAAADAVLELEAGRRVRVGSIRSPGRAPEPGRVLSSFSSRGPALDGTPKPDLAAAGAARTLDPTGRPAVAGGTAVAAAQVAVEAARLARDRPDATPAQLKAALMAAADTGAGERTGIPASGSGAGILRRPPASTPEVSAVITGAKVRLRAPERIPLELRADADPGTTVTVTPTRVRPPATASLRVAAGSGPVSTGRLIASSASGPAALSQPFAVFAGPPPPVEVGSPALTRANGRVTGVRFTLGAFERGDPLGGGTALQAVERLDLELIRADGGVARRLTPTDGARELLPAEYAYTIPRRTASALGSGRLRFRVRARAPRQPEATERRSTAFTAG